MSGSITSVRVPTPRLVVAEANSLSPARSMADAKGAGGGSGGGGGAAGAGSGATGAGTGGGAFDALSSGDGAAQPAEAAPSAD